MCMDSEWMKWANAWQTKGEYSAETLGISYMLSGDEGASNIDPSTGHATGRLLTGRLIADGLIDLFVGVSQPFARGSALRRDLRNADLVRRFYDT